MLKTAGMPFRFWPWALTQFCRIYNYWPKQGHAPPWIMLKAHRFCQKLSRDLHPFGCYVIGRLPREHPEVKDTTHSDRGLEGAFLGWDLHTPTVWIWSFRKKKAVRMHDPVFYNTRFPFKNPEILLNRDLTWDDVKKMHAEDLETGETETGETDAGEHATTTEDDAECSTPPTQPMHLSPAPVEPVPVPSPTPVPVPAARPNTRSQQPPVPAPEPTPTPAPVPAARPNTRSQQPPAPAPEPTPTPTPTPPAAPPVNHRDARTWIRGADIPLDASLRLLSDKQLGRALSHHKLVLQLPLSLETAECPP